MRGAFRTAIWLLGLVCALGMALVVSAPPSARAAENINMIIDGQRVETAPAPLIEDGRTLVPLRLISEQLGARVEWNGRERTVLILKGERSVRLRIDSRLAEYQAEAKIYDVCDVPPRIVSDRTFVPLRLVSNALGVGVAWEASSRTVQVNSQQSVEFTPFFNLKISSPQPNQVIRGATNLQIALAEAVPAGAAEIQYLLLQPESGRGVVVARGAELDKSYRWLPDLQERGPRLLVAVVYDQAGTVLNGAVMPVEMAVVPSVALTGVEPGMVIRGPVTLGADPSFIASFVKYEISNQDQNRTIETEESDPQGSYEWQPMVEDNGKTTFKVTAYDQDGNPYLSQVYSARVEVSRTLALKGVSAGSTIEQPVTLWAARNFQVSQTEYILRDPLTGREEVLARVGYKSYRWFPGPELKGSKELLVRVKDTAGVARSSEAIRVNLTGRPRLLLTGVGPQQVLTGQVSLGMESNIVLAEVEYFLINPQNGSRRSISGSVKPGAEYIWNPGRTDEGSWRIVVVGRDDAGKQLTSEEIPIRIYLGKIYTATPIIEKSKFKEMASELASASRQLTGMSAALQTAQAILETGWGQSVPVDKYTGQPSNNLFGIKGTGPAGSVTSKTWEEFQGETYRIDADFRAYTSVMESWADHKRLLLTASRYEPFREVMHNSTLGAWALKRAGYATDSKYPLKLMDIIKRYNLHLLDEVRM